MSTFLLEIGTEELPADFARLALPQLHQLVAASLQEQRLEHGSIRCTSTPRRLAVTVEAIPAAQPDRQERRKGPPAAQAFQGSTPTPAALGFARRCGVAPEALEVHDTPKGPFVFATVHERGRPAAQVLETLVPGWVQALQGRRFMRWGSGDCRFSRPIRWLVALLDDTVVPVALPGADPAVGAGRLSRGHRLHPDPVTIRSAADYDGQLAAAGVMVDREQRCRWIQDAVTQAADALEARADLPGDLLEELTDLVEQPLLIQGSIDPEALELPAEVLSTVMRAHQRYVPLYRQGLLPDPLAFAAQDTLLPAFLCIGNGAAAASETVRRGNERVLRARLADARFFVEADRAVASIDRREALQRVTFAEGLGTLLDRVDRIRWCTDVLIEAVGLRGEVVEQARRAAHLCKHDLVSQMVGEFPELQGVMGGKYLLAEGEPRSVALAVLEHYLPRGAGDALPASEAGAVLALAERLELLLSIFAKGERPSGSSDPYALRRAGNGLWQILWDRHWRLDLRQLLRRCCGQWANQLPALVSDTATLQVDLESFLSQRLSSLLPEQALDDDVVAAVAGPGVPIGRVLADAGDALERGRLLQRLRRDGRLLDLQLVVSRAARLAEQADLPQDTLSAEGLVDPSLFEKPCEANLFALVEQLAPLAQGEPAYPPLAEALQQAAPVLAALFDGEGSVMVMADDPAIRHNRLALLGVMRNQAWVLGDFRALQG